MKHIRGSAAHQLSTLGDWYSVSSPDRWSTPGY